MKIFLLFMVFTAMLLSGCKREEGPPAGSASVSEPQRAQPPQSSQTHQYSERFMGSELSEIFDMTQGNVEQRYGIPSAQHSETVENVDILVLVYENSLFHIDLADKRVCFAAFTDPEHPPLRGVTVGTAADTALSAFQDDGNPQLFTAQDGRPFRLLYGTYGDAQGYGVVWYEGDLPQSIEYRDGTVATAIFELTDGVVSRIVFKRPSRY